MKKIRKIQIFKALLTFLLFYLRKYMQIIPIVLFHINVKNPKELDNVIVNMFLNFLLVLFLFIIYHKELIDEFKKFKNNFKEYFDTGLRYWMVGLFLMIVTNILITTFTPLTNSSNEISVQSLISISPILMLITAGILAPIVEEITFRKAIKGIFTNKWVFCFVSGFIFGLLHVLGVASSWYEYLYIISYGALGFFFAYSYQKTGTIFTSITMHMLHNSLLIIMSIL